jgi:hypothetical protein
MGRMYSVVTVSQQGLRVSLRPFTPHVLALAYILCLILLHYFFFLHHTQLSQIQPVLFNYCLQTTTLCPLLFTPLPSTLPTRMSFIPSTAFPVVSTQERRREDTEDSQGFVAAQNALGGNGGNNFHAQNPFPLPIMDTGYSQPPSISYYPTGGQGVTSAQNAVGGDGSYNWTQPLNTTFPQALQWHYQPQTLQLPQFFAPPQNQMMPNSNNRIDPASQTMMAASFDQDQGSFPSREVATLQQPYQNSNTSGYAAAQTGFMIPQPQMQPAMPHQVATQQPPLASQTVPTHAGEQKPTCTTTSLRLEDVNDEERFAANDYMSAIAQDDLQMKPSRIPGIAPDFVFNFTNKAKTFQPRDIWCLRHLALGFRYNEYLEFAHLGLLLRNAPQPSIKFDSAWQVLRLKTDLLRKNEQVFYSKNFDELAQGTDEQRQRRKEKWAELTAKEALPICVDTIRQIYDRVVSQGQKRALEDNDGVEPDHLAKKPRVVIDLTDDGPVQEQVENYQQVEIHKDDVSKPKRVVAVPGPEGYWKMSYLADRVNLPDHPSLDIASYTVQVGKKFPYRCFHESVSCAEGKCNHACCKEGYDEKKLETAIRRQVKAYKIGVEKLIHEGMLNERHKWWSKRAWTSKSNPKEVAKRKAASRQPTNAAAPQHQFQLPLNGLVSPSTSQQNLASRQLAAQRVEQEQQHHRQEHEQEQQRRRQEHIQKLSEHTRKVHNLREARLRQWKYPNIAYFDNYWNARRPLTDGETLSEQESRWHGAPNLNKLPDEPLPNLPLLGYIAEHVEEAAVTPSAQQVTATVQPEPEAETEDDGFGAVFMDAYSKFEEDDDNCLQSEGDEETDRESLCEESEEDEYDYLFEDNKEGNQKSPCEDDKEDIQKSVCEESDEDEYSYLFEVGGVNDHKSLLKDDEENDHESLFEDHELQDELSNMIITNRRIVMVEAPSEGHWDGYIV